MIASGFVFGVEEGSKQELHTLAGYGHNLSRVPASNNGLDFAGCSSGSRELLALPIPNAECPDRTWL